jgi:hypothetical protein
MSGVPGVEDLEAKISYASFVDILIRVIPVLTWTQPFGGGIPPNKAKFRLMRMAKNIDVRHDSKRHNEPVFALQMDTLLLGQGRLQKEGLARDRSRINGADGFSVGGQYWRHLTFRDLVRCPYGHQQTDFRRQCRRAPSIVKSNFHSWDIIRYEGANNSRVLNRHPRTLSRFMSGFQHAQLNDVSNNENEGQKRDTAAKHIYWISVPSVPT